MIYFNVGLQGGLQHKRGFQIPVKFDFVNFFDKYLANHFSLAKKLCIRKKWRINFCLYTIIIYFGVGLSKS